MKNFLRSFAVILLSAITLFAQNPPGSYSYPQGQSSGGGGIIGGTFGGNNSSGYTLTSTPITSSPFSGNLLVGALIKTSDVSTLTPGSGWTLDLGSGCTIGIEHQVAGSASSYSAGFTISATSVWAGTISAFNATSPTLAQAAVCATGTNAVSTGSSVAAGNFLFAAFRYNNATGPITAVAGCGATWQFAGLRALESAAKGVGDGNFLEIWYGSSPTAGGCTVTATGITGATAEAAIAVYTGVASSNFTVDYAYNADSTGNTTTTTPAGATTNNQYTINAVNNVNGTTITGRDSGAVFRSVTANMPNGGIIFRKNGTYPGQTSLQENVAGQTNWYIWSMPAPASVSQKVSWHILCESVPQSLGFSPATDSCLDLIMPSAYSGPAPSATLLSGYWLRPAASIGAAGNSAVFFAGGMVRVPDNQRTPTIAYDTFTSTYSSHIGTSADTAIPVAASPSDQTCSGITPASALVTFTGFRTNQSGTNETYFENTWAIGYNVAYNVLSNHPVGINVHSLCNQSAGTFAVASSTYGGIMIHFQDIHNIFGVTLNCAGLGTRYDFLNTIVEVLGTGTFSRNTNAVETTPGNCTGKVDVTTVNISNATYNPFFSSGSGANFRVNESGRLAQPGLLTSNFTSAATTGTSKQTLATYTFVDNTNALGPNYGPFNNNSGAAFHIKTWGITAANGDSKTFEIDFGGTAIATITSTVNNGAIKCDADILVSSVANTQEIVGYCDDGTTRTVTRTAPGITGSANIVLNIAATTGTSAGDFTFKGLKINYEGGQ